MTLSTYIALGWAIFPTNGKIPSTPHGFKDAVTNEVAFADLKRAYGGDGVAIACGPVSGNLVVIDVDPKHGGTESLDALEDELGPLPRNTIYVMTPSGGYHVYMAGPAGVAIRSKVDAFGHRGYPGIDIRAAGGYVVGPPTPGYEFDNGPDEANVQPLPEAWLLAILERQRPAPSVTSDKVAGFILPDKIGEGERNQTLTQFAGQLRRAGMDSTTVLDMLEHVNRERCSPQVEEKELRRIVVSASSWTPLDALPDEQAAAEKDTGGKLDGYWTTDEALAELDRFSKLPRESTGFPLLDKAIGGGLHCTQTYVLVGPPGHGKTSFCCQVVHALAAAGAPVLAWTLEMHPAQLVATLAAQRQDTYSKLDIIHNPEYRHVVEGGLPRNVVYYHKRDLDGLVLALHRARQLGDRPPVVVLDYLQKLATGGDDARIAVEKASEVLRAMAMEYQCSLLIVSSASRPSARLIRDSRSTPISELVSTGREAGAIEYDSAAVMTLGLEDEEASSSGWRPAILTVAKARWGTEQKLEYQFHGARGEWQEVGRVSAFDALREAIIDAVREDGFITSVNALAMKVKGGRNKVLAAIKALRENGVLGGGTSNEFFFVRGENC